MNRRVNQNQLGFTLIELLVVIAIIAILAAILFPVFAKVREKARQITCASNMRQIGLGFLQYNQDYDDHYPTGWDGNLGQGWAGNVYPYVKSPGVFHCPDDPQTASSSGGITFYPVCTPGNLNFLRTDPGSATDPHSGQALASLNSPSKTVLLSEVTGITGNITTPGEPGSIIVSAVNNGNFDGSLYPFATGDGNGGNVETGCLGGLNCAPYVLSGPYQEGFKALTGWHTDGSNFLMADGHVKWFRGSSVSGGSNATAPDCVQGGGSPADCTTTVQTMAAGTDNSQFAVTFSTQ